MTLLIKNGRVIDPASRTDRVADILIVDGRVVGIGFDLSVGEAEVFDASGMIVAPGFIDIHVHLREPGFERLGGRPPQAAQYPVCGHDGLLALNPLS